MSPWEENPLSFTQKSKEICREELCEPTWRARGEGKESLPMGTDWDCARCVTPDKQEKLAASVVRPSSPLEERLAIFPVALVWSWDFHLVEWSVPEIEGRGHLANTCYLFSPQG